MIGRRALAVALVLTASGAGCGTVDNIRRPMFPAKNSENSQLCRAYGGLRGDFGTMTEYPWRNPPTYLDYIIIPAMAVVDLGLTAFGDTVTLPYTVGVEVWRALHPEGRPSMSLPQVDTVPSPTPVPVTTAEEPDGQ